MSKHEVRIDFSSVTPGACFKTIPYHLNSGDSMSAGKMIVWTCEEAPILRISHSVFGWYEIHLGFMGPSGLRIRLQGEQTFRKVETSTRWDWKSGEGEETYFRTADLSGRDFELLPHPIPRNERRSDNRESRLAYIRLVPISEKEAMAQREAWSNPHTHTAGAVIDGDVIGSFSPRSPSEVEAMLEPFVESDFKRIFWGCTVTSMRMNYLTKIGYWIGKEQDIEAMHSSHFRRSARSYREAERQGYDPLEVLINYARTHGMELWPSFRIQQDYPKDYSGGIGEDLNSPVADEHPEWRHVDCKGAVSSHLFSHFHPEWEQYKLDLLAEIARKGPAGIHMNLMCEVGTIWDFEPRAVARFKERYGLDPCATDEPPKEWYQFRCDHFTDFMRRLRVQTNKIAEEIGCTIPIAVQVSAEWSVLLGEPYGARTVSANFLHGYDIRRWAKEGLVDIIAPSFRRTHRPMFLEHILEELGPYRDRIELAPSLGQHVDEVLPKGYDWAVYFTDTGEGGADLVPFGELDAWRVLREANDLYLQGVDAVDVWEVGGAPARLARWNVLKRIGHREELAERFGTMIEGLMGRREHPLLFEFEKDVEA